MHKISIHSILNIEAQNKIDYIPKDSEDISQLDYNKKKQVQKAICWLLSIAPHSVEEIAEHFEISPELVKGLIMKLSKANLVVQVPGSNRYNLQ